MNGVDAKIIPIYDSDLFCILKVIFLNVINASEAVGYKLQVLNKNTVILDISKLRKLHIHPI